MPLVKAENCSKQAINKAVSQNIRTLVEENKRLPPAKRRSRDQIIAIAIRAATEDCPKKRRPRK